ncbi:response regulator transcription factor [Actinoplanes sp. NPDC051859]|uniref:response regulator transcription factor n=1 Tax=Actinoplanes sp. NPDC051859 TaxID=3363909 RepID=UPI0037B45BBA
MVVRGRRLGTPMIVPVVRSRGMSCTTGSRRARQVRVLVVAADLVRRAGLSTLLRQSDGIDVIGETCDEAAALSQARAGRPDVVLLDGPPWWAERVCASLRAYGPVLLIGDRTPLPPEPSRGPAGQLVPGEFSVEELAGSVRWIATGRTMAPPRPLRNGFAVAIDGPDTAHDRAVGQPAAALRFGLSRREGEIMEHVVRGIGNADIAQRLFISEKTVKNHVNHIYRKLRATNRAEAIARWLGLATA